MVLFTQNNYQVRVMEVGNLESKNTMNTLLLDHQLQESCKFVDSTFPINYYVDDFNHLANHQVPLHWHLGHEFFTTIYQDIEIQVGRKHLFLRKGETILIGGGQLHSYRMTNPDKICLCPNIVFTNEVLTPITNTIFKKYFSQILNDLTLPYIVFSPKNEWQLAVLENLFKVYALLEAANDKLIAYHAIEAIKSDCPEIEIHQHLISIFQTLYCHRAELQHMKADVQGQQTQIRMRKMLHYIHEHFKENISLEQLADSAGISRSEAGRCFKMYYAQSPMSYVTLYRLKYAQELLLRTPLSINEIAFQCGFRDSSYFVKVFRRYFGKTPSKYRTTCLGI